MTRTPLHRRAPRASVLALLLTTGIVAPVQTWPGRSRAHAAPADMRLIQQELSLVPDAPLMITITPPRALVGGDRFRVTVYPAVEELLDLDAIIDDPEVLGRRVLDALDLPEAAVATDTKGNVAIQIPTESATRGPDAIQFPNEGLYPLIVDLFDERSIQIGEILTFVHRQALPTSERRGALNVATVVSITAPPLIPGESTALADAVLDQVDRLIAFPENAHLTLDISPDVVARLDPDRLAQLRPVLARSLLTSTPRIPFDPSSAAQAGLQDLFTRLLVDGENTMAELGETATDRSVWVSPTSLTTAGAALLRDRGVRLIVVTPDTYAAAEGGIGGYLDPSQLFQTRLSDEPPAEGRPCDAGCMPTAVIDPRLQEWLTATELEAERRALYIAANLVVWRDQLASSLSPVTGHTVVVGLSDGSVPDPALLGRVMEMVLPTEAVVATDLSEIEAKTDFQLVDGTSIDVRLQSPVPVDVSGRGRTLLPVGASALAVASMLVNDNGRRELWQDTIEVLYSTAVTDRQIADTVARLDAEFFGITSNVLPRPPSSFTLNGRRTDVPLRFENTGAEDLLIVIRLDAGADKLQFPNGDQIELLEAGATREVPVAMVARANGSVTVNLNVVTPVGDRAIVPTIALQAKVNTLTGLAQVITGGALLILLTWWVRNVRRSRRARRNGKAMGEHPAGRQREQPAVITEAVIGATPAPEAELAEVTEMMHGADMTEATTEVSQAASARVADS